MDVDESTPSESALDQQIREIENQVAHLVRSNAEIKEILETEGGDKELRTAIVRVACPPASPCYAHRTFSSHVFPFRTLQGENIVAIARRRAILEDLHRSVPQPTKAAPAADIGISL